MISGWTVVLVCAIAFFIVRGIVRGHRRVNRPPSTNPAIYYSDTATAGLLFSDFFSHAHHSADAYGGGFGDTGSFGGGDMGGGAGDGRGGGGGT